MGYENYFARILRENLEQIRSFNIEELCIWAKSKNEKYVDDNFVDYDSFLEKACYSLGKLYFEDTDTQIENVGERLFKNEDTNDMYSEYNFLVVDKQGVLKAIEIYKKKVYEMYEKLQANYTGNIPSTKLTREEYRHKKIEELIRNKFLDLGLDLVDLSGNKDRLTNSWSYEYAIFNLVNIYKNTDWDKYSMVFYGR